MSALIYVETSIAGFYQVRRLRQASGLSQPTLLAKCPLMGGDIGHDTIARIEGQTRWVGDAELVHLARRLAVPLDALFSKRDPANPAAKAAAPCPPAPQKHDSSARSARTCAASAPRAG